MKGMAIGEAAQKCGIKVPTIRYYEQIGLLPAPPRSVNNRRFYSDSDIHRLAFIRHARELGFDIDAIKTLMSLQDDPRQSCKMADIIAKARLAEVDQRIRSLTALKEELERMVEGCRHGRVEECRVLETLSEHSKCRCNHH